MSPISSLLKASELVAQGCDDQQRQRQQQQQRSVLTAAGEHAPPPLSIATSIKKRKHGDGIHVGRGGDTHDDGDENNNAGGLASADESGSSSDGGATGSIASRRDAYGRVRNKPWTASETTQLTRLVSESVPVGHSGPVSIERWREIGSQINPPKSAFMCIAKYGSLVKAGLLKSFHDTAAAAAAQAPESRAPAATPVSSAAAATTNARIGDSDSDADAGMDAEDDASGSDRSDASHDEGSDDTDESEDDESRVRSRERKREWTAGEIDELYGAISKFVPLGYQGPLTMKIWKKIAAAVTGKSARECVREWSKLHKRHGLTFS